jgi:SAM-dependent methyltransferase
MLDAPHERRLGVDTSLITGAFFDFKTQVVECSPVPYPVLDAVRKHMDANGVAARRFIDLGCGLGRPLYYFADRFDALHGYEIAPPLYDAAREQLERVRPTHPLYGRIALHNADATTQSPLDAPTVLFLYNPFGPKPLARLAERLKAVTRETHVYYANPVERAVLDRELGRLPDDRFRALFNIDYYRLP